MKWDTGSRRYALSTGRELYANLGILGLGESERGTLYDGYDGIVENEYLREMIAQYPGSYDEQKALTDNERREIAEYMIARWQEWGIKG